MVMVVGDQASYINYVNAMQTLFDILLPSTFQVEHITVSWDGKWIASYCSGQILKIWNVSNKMQESASIGLSLVITGFKFSDKSTYLTVYGQKENGQRKVFVFKLLILSKI